MYTFINEASRLPEAKRTKRLVKRIHFKRRYVDLTDYVCFILFYIKFICNMVISIFLRLYIFMDNFVLVFYIIYFTFVILLYNSKRYTLT